MGTHPIFESDFDCLTVRLLMSVKLFFHKLSENAVTPIRGSKFSAGLDLSSAEDKIIPANGRGLVKTDLQVAIPDGCYGRIAPRSGLAYKKGIDVGAGVIDQDYRGPVGVILFNFGDESFEIKQGDRIAQFILEKICIPEVILSDEKLPDTIRGAAGFGSTGVSTILQEVETNNVHVEQKKPKIAALIPLL